MSRLTCCPISKLAFATFCLHTHLLHRSMLPTTRFCHAIVKVPLAHVQHELITYPVHTGEGLGFLWPYLAGYPTDKIAVIDKACAMRPGRPTMPWVLPQPKQVKLKMRLQVWVASVTQHAALPEASGQPISGFSCHSCRTLLLFLASCTWALSAEWKAAAD